MEIMELREEIENADSQDDVNTVREDNRSTLKLYPFGFEFRLTWFSRNDG